MDPIFPSGLVSDEDYLSYAIDHSPMYGDLIDGQSHMTSDFPNRNKAEIISIEETLGINVQGTADDLATRLWDLISQDGKVSMFNIVDLANGDTVPDVSSGNIIRSNNTTTTYVGGYTGGTNYQSLYHILDHHTVIRHNVFGILTLDGNDIQGTDGLVIQYIYTGSYWLEVGRIPSEPHPAASGIDPIDVDIEDQFVSLKYDDEDFELNDDGELTIIWRDFDWIDPSGDIDPSSGECLDLTYTIPITIIEPSGNINPDDCLDLEYLFQFDINTSGGLYTSTDPIDINSYDISLKYNTDQLDTDPLGKLIITNIDCGTW
jgi:hypothetical protein